MQLSDGIDTNVRPPKFVQQPDRKPKPVKPITKGMIEGKEPMRTFSDL